MCGRYDCNKEDAEEMQEILREINERYMESQEILLTMHTGVIAPSHIAPVLALEKGVIHAGLMKWGMPKLQGSGVNINARSETAHTLPSFKDSLERRRCIIPATGFYEWEREREDGGKKGMYSFHLPNQPVIYMAGLYKRYTDKAGNPYTAYVILTRDANRSMNPIHDRQPVILLRDQREQWLSDYRAARDILMQPFDTDFDIKRVTA